MQTRSRSTRLLATAVAVAMLAAIYAVGGARPAQAIIIIDNKTGMFTLTQGEAARVHVVNTGEQRGGIIPCTKFLDGDGNLLAEFRGRALTLGQADSFVYIPPDPQQPMAIRVELTIEGVSSKDRANASIPTCEVFDTATGKTSVGQDFIIIVNG